MKKTILAVTLAAGLTSFTGNAKGQTTTNTFGSGGNTFTLDFQTIGNVGNAADTTGYGAVNYNYSIGTYVISQNQLNAATANGLLGVAGGAWSGDQPAANVSWLQAAAFVNWLNTSTGHQAAYNLTYSGGAYTMALWQSGDSGYDPSNPFRNSLALFVLPSENEWYKAAYYNPSNSNYSLYPYGNSIPTAVASGTNANTSVYNSVASMPASVYQAGGLSAYGTMGQAGNVFQLMESAYSGSNTNPTDNRTFQGGFWGTTYPSLQSSANYSIAPTSGMNLLSFRVAEVSAVPEPSAYILFGLGGLALVVAYRRRVM